jgi:hypothetical protein
MREPVWHNSALRRLRPHGRYNLEHVDAIERALAQHQTLKMRPLPSGLFRSVEVSAENERSGYGNVWVRDNVFVAYAHHRCGASDVAARTMKALFEFFARHDNRFRAIIARKADPDDPMQRPHVRFDGVRMRELEDARWPHAQNDALGYALWLLCVLAREGVMAIGARDRELLTLFVHYFDAIRFWQDEDSGHWEEARKCSASSIGAVVAGLEALLAWDGRSTGPQRAALDAHVTDRARELVVCGRDALTRILPNECAQRAPEKNRRYDAALLFLVHPLGIVMGEDEALILADIERYLSGRHGVRRYLGDSYWSPDYDELVPEIARSADYSENMQARDALLDSIGQEAQWCIFDPVLSAHYGRRFQLRGAEADFDLQVHHFERSLAQVTDTWRCPELYFLKHGVYVANPHTPLSWTQSNLMVALTELRESLRLRLSSAGDGGLNGGYHRKPSQ